MSREKVERLPGLFREIVLHDREMEKRASAAVVPFQKMKEMFARRRELARHAIRAWWPGHKGGKTVA